MDNKILNITNGDTFNGYLLSKLDGTAVPFREAMMDGDTVADIYSDGFVTLRAVELSVSEAQYRANMVAYDALQNGEYSSIILWFGKDTFCQMNLITLLAYLEQIGYNNALSLNYIDDETFEVIEENIPVELGIYHKIYEDILIHKQTPSELGILFPDTVRLYFDYHSPDGALAKAVRANSDMKHMELICLLLKISKEYGLSDIQAKKLIECSKEKR